MPVAGAGREAEVLQHLGPFEDEGSTPSTSTHHNYISWRRHSASGDHRLGWQLQGRAWVGQNSRKCLNEPSGSG